MKGEKDKAVKEESSPIMKHENQLKKNSRTSMEVMEGERGEKVREKESEKIQRIFII